MTVVRRTITDAGTFSHLVTVLVDLEEPTPVYGNPGAVLVGGRIERPAGRHRRCEPCGVRWVGEDPCWVCGQ